MERDGGKLPVKVGLGKSEIEISLSNINLQCSYHRLSKGTNSY